MRLPDHTGPVVKCLDFERTRKSHWRISCDFDLVFRFF